MFVSIDDIRVSKRVSRKRNEAKTLRYQYLFEAGASFPPITLLDCGGFYTVRDGRHRLQAQINAGFLVVEARLLNQTRKTIRQVGRMLRGLLRLPP